MVKRSDLFPSTWQICQGEPIFWEFDPSGSLNEYRDQTQIRSIGRYIYFPTNKTLLLETGSKTFLFHVRPINSRELQLLDDQQTITLRKREPEQQNST